MTRLSSTLGESCPHCQAKQVENPSVLRVNAILLTDPTRTTTLRHQFVLDMDKRFNELKRDIRVSIIQNDVFGLEEQVLALMEALFFEYKSVMAALQIMEQICSIDPTERQALVLNAPAPIRAFDFPRTSDKIDGFMDWLEEQERIGILEISRRPGGLRGGIEEAWTDIYIRRAYARGIPRARAELRRAGYDVRSIDETPGGVNAIMSQPFHADRVGVLYTRTFEDLKSVTQVMNAQTRRLIAEGLTIGLARGIAEGKSPKVIARELYKDVANRVDKIGKTRARMIARTEVIRAHHLATIEEYRQADAEMMVGVKAEWATAGFNVCAICAGLEGKVFTLNEIEGMLPAHPRCRCVALPVVKEKGERGR